ncbi:hypothetical protein PMAYCL1PPCAC_12895, partial [Pristionchus mayeri]
IVFDYWKHSWPLRSSRHRESLVQTRWWHSRRSILLPSSSSSDLRVSGNTSVSLKPWRFLTLAQSIFRMLGY